MRISRRASFAQGATFFVALFGSAAFSPNANGDSALLNAASAGGSYYGMYCTSCVGVEFALNGSYDISTIDVVLRTPAATTFTTFDFSLMTSATDTIFTQGVTASLGGVSTEALDVNEILSAGTYYLVGNVPGYLGTTVTPGDVDGWLLSTGAFTGAAGTITNGLGFFTGSTWFENTANAAPAFTVNGSAVPEPSTISIVFVGLLLGCVMRRRLIPGHHA